MASEFVRIYTGSEVNVQHLQNLLRDVGIESVVKNNFESGRLSGFGGGFIGQVRLFVLENQAQEAREIVKKTFPDQVDEEEE